MCELWKKRTCSDNYYVHVIDTIAIISDNILDNKITSDLKNNFYVSLHNKKDIYKDPERSAEK